MELSGEMSSPASHQATAIKPGSDHHQHQRGHSASIHTHCLGLTGVDPQAEFENRRER